MWPLSKNSKGKSKKAPAKRGVKEAQSLKRRRRLSILFRLTSLFVVCLGVISSLYVWKSGLLQQWMTEAEDTVDRKIADAGFTVGEVRITGQENTTLHQVRSALAIYDGQSIVSLDLDKMLARVEALPWVKTATIIRIMPDALEVTITEYKAAAIWQSHNELYLVDNEGKIITDRGLEHFPNQPHVVGLGGNENLASLFVLRDRNPGLFARVKSAIWIGNRRWDLNLDNGVKIKLPEKGSELAWERLTQYESKQKILSKEVLVVDLRMDGKTILRLTPEEAERRRMMQKAGSEAGKKESI